MRQLTGQDASFLYVETPNTPSHGISLNIYDQSTAPGRKVTFKQILANIEERLHVAGPLRERLVRVPMDIDHPYWVDDRDFDLEFHVRHLALPKPGDWRQLCIQCARLIARPLDLARPPWELYVIEGLDNVEGVPEGAFAVLLKMHHAAMDGHSGTQLITALHAEAPDTGPPPPPEHEWKPEPEPTPWDLLARAQLNHAMMPWRFAETVGRTAPAAPQSVFPNPFATPFPNPFATPFPNPFATSFANPFAPLGAGPFPTEPLPTIAPPRTRFNANVTAHRVLDGRQFPLDDVKQMKACVEGATVNDTLLAMVGGALREYLEAKDELPTESLVAMVPVSVRREGDDHLANRVAAMFVPIGTHIADPIERIAAVRQATTESKVQLDAVDARTLTEFSQFMPGGLVGAASRLAAEMEIANTAQPVFNTVVTNVPGPQQPLYWAGARCVGQWGFGPITNNAGLFHNIGSYCGDIYLSFNSCPKMVPDPAFYAACVQRSHGAMLNASA
jgi:diacylglycerol O-acyltransferase / wax synthase